MTLGPDDPLSAKIIAAVRAGDVAGITELLERHPGLAGARLVDKQGIGRTLLLVATDWPGHFPQVARTISSLIAAGADPNAAITGHPHCAEAPLHSAASSDDVEAIDALLDGGARLENPGAVFTNGTAMSDAVIFAQWNAARRLLARGATTTLTESAALGLMDRVAAYWAMPDSAPPPERVTAALWHACRGGQHECVEYLLARGADLNWVGWDHMTPLDCALKGNHTALAAWLRERGAVSAPRAR